MTDARSKFEFRRLKVPELKHILKGKRIPYTEKKPEEFVLLDERTESWEGVTLIINKFPDRSDSALDWYHGTGTSSTVASPVLRFGLGLLYGKYWKYLTEMSSLKTSWPHHCNWTRPFPWPWLQVGAVHLGPMLWHSLRLWAMAMPGYVPSASVQTLQLIVF